MKITDIISLNKIFLNFEVTSKKILFKEISQIISKNSDLTQTSILDNLIQREKLGTTGIGDGIALPHSKIKGIKKILSLFIRLQNPIDFSANDSKKVDIIFVIIAPDESKTDHLLALSEISKFLRINGNTEKLRKYKTKERIFKLLSNFSEG
tara:strand:+ start:589 stop:1044 length:456 start_codon:yes stop_codon:yes gene_type:complete